MRDRAKKIALMTIFGISGSFSSFVMPNTAPANLAQILNCSNCRVSENSNGTPANIAMTDAQKKMYKRLTKKRKELNNG